MLQVYDRNRPRQDYKINEFLHFLSRNARDSVVSMIFGETVPKNRSELLPIQVGNRRGERARESKNENRNRGRRGRRK